MRLSEAIRKGIERFPEKTIGANSRGDKKACADGCARFAYTGDPNGRGDSDMPQDYIKGWFAFLDAYGYNIIAANDRYDLPREEIVRMLEEIGH